eukprot:3421-Heterococcus_DN1.PRE.2
MANELTVIKAHSTYSSTHVPYLDAAMLTCNLLLYACAHANTFMYVNTHTINRAPSPLNVQPDALEPCPYKLTNVVCTDPPLVRPLIPHSMLPGDSYNSSSHRGSSSSNNSATAGTKRVVLPGIASLTAAAEVVLPHDEPSSRSSSVYAHRQDGYSGAAVEQQHHQQQQQQQQYYAHQMQQRPQQQQQQHARYTDSSSRGERRQGSSAAITSRAVSRPAVTRPPPVQDTLHSNYQQALHSTGGNGSSSSGAQRQRDSSSSSQHQRQRQQQQQQQQHAATDGSADDPWIGEVRVTVQVDGGYSNSGYRKPAQRQLPEQISSGGRRR